MFVLVSVSSKMFFRGFLSALLGLLFIASCGTGDGRDELRSFYYWKTNYSIDSAETVYMDSLGVNHLYLHYLDVDWSENRKMPIPRTELEIGSVPGNTKYTPVIFITNRVFERMSREWVDSLASRIAGKTTKITEEIEDRILSRRAYRMYPVNNYYDETRRIHDSIKAKIRAERKDMQSQIQIDCDWTASTRDNYFYFLKRLRHYFPDKKISATIRLYPYKYNDKMGVPPVDRGMLMCYNLASIHNPLTKSSVFDLKEMEKYLTDDYPLPLDAALPVFGWYAWFRDGKLKGIVYEPENFVQNKGNDFLSASGNSYQLLKDTVIQNQYFREGDILRKEFPSAQELEQAAKRVRKHISRNGTIAFYHWDPATIKPYETAIKKVYSDR